MIHLRIIELEDHSYLTQALCGEVNKDKTVTVVDLEDVNCKKCRAQILTSIEKWGE